MQTRVKIDETPFDLENHSSRSRKGPMNVSLLCASILMPHVAPLSWKRLPPVDNSYFENTIWSGAAVFSDDASILCGLNRAKVLSVIDLSTGRDRFNENVFLCREESGKLVALTDSQVAHVRNQVTLLSLTGRTVAPLGKDCYLVQLYGADEAKKTTYDTLVAVFPKKRGTNSNVILTRFPHRRGFVAYPDSDTSGVGITVGLRVDRQIELLHWVISNSAPRVIQHSTVKLNSDIWPHDISWQQRKLISELEIWRIGVTAFDGATKFLDFPRSGTANYHRAKLIGGTVVAWCESNDPSESKTFIWQELNWKELGTYAYVARSVDGKLLIFRDKTNNLWLAKADEL